MVNRLRHSIPKVGTTVKRIAIVALHKPATACKLAIGRAEHAEHVGFAAYATCEVFHWGGAIWYVSAWLAATGLVVFFLKDIRPG